MSDIYSLLTSALPPGTKVVGVKGVEALSRPYRFEVGVTVPAVVEVDLSSALGTRASLLVDRGFGAPPFTFHGVIGAIEHVHEVVAKALYRVTIVPLMWTMGLTLHSRIFTDATIPEILEATFQYSGLGASDYSLRLAGTYKKLEHVCQYKESNLDFVARLMEREGIYYFFEQGDDREVLVVTDHRSFSHHLAPAPIKYFPLIGQDVTSEELIGAFACKVSALPGLVKLKDYDYLKPALDVSGTAMVKGGTTGEIVSYGDNFLTPEDGARYAQLRAEELSARGSVFQGWGRAFYLRPGYLFTLEDHPRPAFNGDYLVTELRHHGNQAVGSPQIKQLLDLEYDDVYRIGLVAIPSSVQFRAQRATPSPRIDGVVGGVVDSEQGGPYADIDDHGRYKLSIFFDESDLTDGSRSTWVRMLQPHGGSVEGFHFPLRKGTEVHVVFLGGDPDRPVIAAVAPNPQKPSPVTSGNHTQNVLQTGGSNRLVMEDQAGGQFVTMSSPVLTSFLHLGSGPYNFVAKTDGNAWVSVGQNMDVEVGAHKTEDVTGPVTEKYLSTQDTTVSGAVTKTFESTYDLTVSAAVTKTFESTLDVAVTDAVTETYDATYEQTVAADVTIDHQAHQKVSVGAGKEEAITGDLKHDISGHVTQTIGGTYKQTVGVVDWFTQGDTFKVHQGNTSDTFIGLKNSNFIGGQFNFTLAYIAAITLGASDTLRLSSDFTLAAGEKIDLNLTNRFTLNAGTAVTINAGLRATFTTGVDMTADAAAKIDLLGGPKVQQAPVNIYVVSITIIA